MPSHMEQICSSQGKGMVPSEQLPKDFPASSAESTNTMSESFEAEWDVDISLIAQSLTQDFYCIYYVNAQTGHFVQLSNQGPRHRLVPERTGDDFFSFIHHTIRQNVLPEDQQILLSISERNSLLQELEDDQVFSMVYRKVVDGQSIHINLKALRLSEGDVHLVIGLRNIEAQIRREQEYQIAQNERITYSRIARALAQDYFCIYYVSTMDSSFVEYSASGQLHQLHEERRGSDFFSYFREQVLTQVYKEDRSKVKRLWRKEIILKELSNARSFATTYRILMNREPHYVRFKATRLEDDEHQIIIGVSNIDTEMRRELEYLQAQELALRDDLTGVKNKRSYSQAEQTLAHLIGNDPTLRFAVVVGDVNDLKLVNDTEGHSAGDQYIRTACDLLCNTFAHSPVYRIGGDEFVALLFGRDYDSRAALIQTLYQKSDQCKSPGGLPILSFGMSDYLPGEDNALIEVFERADSAMYEQKSQFKAKHQP